MHREREREAQTYTQCVYLYHSISIYIYICMYIVYVHVHVHMLCVMCAYVHDIDFYHGTEFPQTFVHSTCLVDNMHFFDNMHDSKKKALPCVPSLDKLRRNGQQWSWRWLKRLQIHLPEFGLKLCKSCPSRT